MRFCAELRRELGDQKIDVLVELPTRSVIQEQAQRISEAV